jgi:signal transduction histidine kinase
LLENLFENAVDHGGGDVTVSVGSTPAGFYIADDGDGIDVEARQEAFDAGYTTTAEGTGFGLNIVDRVATAHDWDVDLSESANGGARFDITVTEAPDPE